MRLYLKLFFINILVGLIYPPLYYLFLTILGWDYISTGLVIDTIGALQGVLWYYLGQRNDK